MSKFIIFLIIIPAFIIGQNRFAKIYDESERELFAHSMVYTNDGGYAVAGYSNTTPDHNMLILKLLDDGTLKWAKKFLNSFHESPISIIQTTDEGYILAGWTESFGAGSADFIVVKLNHEGILEWAKTFGGDDAEIPYSIIQTTDNGYAVIGFTKSFGSGLSDILILKLNSTGEVVWTKTFGGPNPENAFAIIQTVNGKYVITGFTESFGAGSADFLILELNSEGLLLRSKTWGGPNVDAARSLVQTNNSGYVMAGITRSFGAGDWDFLITNVDSDLNLQWTKTIGTDGTDWTYSLIKATDGGYGLAGVTEPFRFVTVATFLKLTTLGDLEWAKEFDGPGITDEARSIVQTADGGYTVFGYTNSFNGIDTDFDLLLFNVNADGEYPECPYIQDVRLDISLCDLLSSIPSLIETVPPLSISDVSLQTTSPIISVTDICPPHIEFLYSNDPQALAYNSNRHLIRKPNTQELHLIYTSLGEIIYHKSQDGGLTWQDTKILGEGKFPAIALGSDNLPSIAWTDDEGGLWYAKQELTGAWRTNHIYEPFPSPIPPPVVAGPVSVAIVARLAAADFVHILTPFAQRVYPPSNYDVWYSLQDFSFPIFDPYSGSYDLIEEGLNIAYAYPSITKDFQNRLHAVWQRADTICYATREIEQEWNNWGWQFDVAGLQSAHPFVETHGDSVFVVWQHIEPTTRKEDVYRAARHLSYSFSWWNLSQTLNTPSLMPVNAGGTFTVFADFPAYPPADDWFEIYYKIRSEDPLSNISQTPSVWSFYPHSAARFTWLGFYLYTAWLEGNESPYEVRFKRLFSPGFEAPAYLTSPNGYETPSLYLIARDSFVSEWPIPVDVGYETITYQFPLQPGFRYRIKVIAYHESSGQWKEWIIIDGKMKHIIKYNAYEPETLEFWVSPAFYKDGVIEVVFDKITGLYAGIGPIWVYQYEYEEEAEEMVSGPMAQQSYPLNSGSIAIFPNPFKEKIDIRLQMADNSQRISLKIYDVTGRLVKNLLRFTNDDGRTTSIVWNGCDENGRAIPQGVYFLEFKNADTKEIFCQKVIKVE